MRKYTIAKHVSIKDDIQIYLLGISKNTRHCNKAIIPQIQKDDIKKYRIKHDSDKRLLARSFLYECLHNHYGINNFELGYNEYKKPFLKADPSIGFSFSYSKDYLLVGISGSKKLGVDIEHINLNYEVDEIAPEIMCPSEREQFNTFPSGSTDQHHYFFSIFSAKESIIKCFGTGLYYDVKKICVGNNADYSYLGAMYTYHPLGVWKDEYVLSLCYEK